MFQKVNVPILGVVQNMSHYVCPNCSHKSFIFRRDGAQKLASDLKLELLGDIPLHADICETSDAGSPIVISQPAGDFATAYRSIAEKIVEKLTNR